MDILQLCIAAGAGKAVQLSTSQLVIQPELRAYCQQNACGRFGRNYTCPPHVGEVNILAQRLLSLPHAVLWQNVYAIEDSFDFEGMMSAQQKHNDMTLAIAHSIRQAFPQKDVLVLAAGGCCLCNPCFCIAGEPCPRPQDALSSLEAYGINVAELQRISPLQYLNGSNTVTFFSGAFFESL